MHSNSFSVKNYVWVTFMQLALREHRLSCKQTKENV